MLKTGTRRLLEKRKTWPKLEKWPLIDQRAFQLRVQKANSPKREAAKKEKKSSLETL